MLLLNLNSGLQNKLLRSSSKHLTLKLHKTLWNGSLAVSISKANAGLKVMQLFCWFALRYGQYISSDQGVPGSMRALVNVDTALMAAEGRREGSGRRRLHVQPLSLFSLRYNLRRPSPVRPDIPIFFATLVSTWTPLLLPAYRAEYICLCVCLFVLTTRLSNCVFSCRPKYSIRENRSAYKVFMWLVIRSFGSSDIGTYNCVSTNSLGRAEGTLRLYGESHCRWTEPTVMNPVDWILNISFRKFSVFPSFNEKIRI
jgi:hypothetical protein